jgi:hypothetical protein
VPIVEIDTNNLMHIQLQPHLYKPPRPVDARDLLAGVHQMGGLMEHMVNTSQEVLPKGMRFPVAKSSAIAIWFKVGSLALPQKINLQSHMFRKALYSTSDRGPSRI